MRANEVRKIASVIIPGKGDEGTSSEVSENDFSKNLPGIVLGVAGLALLCFVSGLAFSTPR